MTGTEIKYRDHKLFTVGNHTRIYSSGKLIAVATGKDSADSIEKAKAKVDSQFITEDLND